MLNRSASLAMSTSILKALLGKLDIKRHSPSILYISASLAMSTSILKALLGKLDIKRHSPSILYFSSQFMLHVHWNGDIVVVAQKFEGKCRAVRIFFGLFLEF